MRSGCCTVSTLQKVLVVFGAVALCHLVVSLVWGPYSWGFTTTTTTFSRIREDEERTAGAPSAVLDSQTGGQLRAVVKTVHGSETNRVSETKLTAETENLKDIRTGKTER